MLTEVVKWGIHTKCDEYAMHMRRKFPRWDYIQSQSKPAARRPHVVLEIEDKAIVAIIGAPQAFLTWVVIFIVTGAKKGEGLTESEPGSWTLALAIVRKTGIPRRIHQIMFTNIHFAVGVITAQEQ